MKILITYLKPYKWLVFLVLILAAINIGFSLCDPIIFGYLVNLANKHHVLETGNGPKPVWHDFLFSMDYKAWGVIPLLIASISVAMISRIAKNFQDYFMTVAVQKFGARVFTDGLKHAMKLPYHEFEDQRSGETLSVLSKVRADTEKFIGYFVNILFTVVVGIVVVSVFAVRIHWSLPFVYFGGIGLLMFISNLLSKKVKTIQKTIVKETTALAGATTEILIRYSGWKSLK